MMEAKIQQEEAKVDGIRSEAFSNRAQGIAAILGKLSGVPLSNRAVVDVAAVKDVGGVLEDPKIADLVDSLTREFEELSGLGMKITELPPGHPEEGESDEE